MMGANMQTTNMASNLAINLPQLYFGKIYFIVLFPDTQEQSPKATFRCILQGMDFCIYLTLLKHHPDCPIRTLPTA